MTPSLSLKSNVDVIGTQEEIFWAVLVATLVLAEMGFPCIITSVNDSVHSLTSLHNVGAAIDIRVRDPGNGWSMSDADRTTAVTRIKSRLTQDFDVIDEGDHLHIEYQRRTRT